MTIGVMGCLPSLPIEFPISYPENSGNMIHANAPFEMFHDCVFIRDHKSKFKGQKNFSEFVNKHCSHLIITLANTLKFGETDGSKYIRLIDFIEKINVPIVVFGLGIQSINDEHENLSLPNEAIEFIKILSKKSNIIGVRGELTKVALHDFCGVDNVMVTGCPSFFSRPHTLPLLKNNLKLMEGKIAYNGTHYFKDAEKVMLYRSIKNNEFLIEPVNKHNHLFFQNILKQKNKEESIPYYFKNAIKNNDLKREELYDHFGINYKLFRSVKEWYEFNEEFVKATYGTRFHVNMASLISGKPALWVTHDSRTRELTKFLNLPAVPLEVANQLSGEELIDNFMNYDNFFENVGDLYENFNTYLKLNKLPILNFMKYL